MNMILLRLITAGLLPAVVAMLFYGLEKRGRWAARPYWLRQTVIGVSFGALAILGTEFGIPVDGAVLNVRSAAPVTAGLVFGWPAGVIAGVVGGVERWFASLWGVGTFTRLACTLATVMAGLFGAAVRVWLLDDRKPGAVHGMAVGAVTEVLHMLMVFLTNTDDVTHAFLVVQKCALPMIVSNSLSVMLAVWCVAVVSEKKLPRHTGIRRISQTFQRWLLLCVAAAFLVTTLFTASFQTRLSMASAENLLRQSLQDVKSGVMEASDTALLRLTEQITRALPENATSERLQEMLEVYNVAEINVIDEDGVVALSSHPPFTGYRMDSNRQSEEFLCLLSGETSWVQTYQPIGADPLTSRKYAGVAVEGGFVQVGYDAEQFQTEIREQVQLASHNRHIGQDGFVLICDSRGVIVSEGGGHKGEDIGVLGEGRFEREDTLFRAVIHGAEACCMYTQTEGYYLLGVLPAAEAMFFRNAAVYILAFMETVVFAALFAYIYFLIKRLIVNNIQKINHSLGQITGGDLTVTVDVRSNEEFASLSDDINTTVEALRRLIDEAAARIDQELEFARRIQLSALPSVFPPYPNRPEMEIYACMHAAKEVGGDFYDFYFVDDHRFVMTIADVSGKGIPAALFMMKAKTVLKSSAETGMQLEDVFTQANRKLLENNDANMFVTVWTAMADLNTGMVTIANAGHNPPILCPAGQPCAYHRTRAGLVMAASERIRYRQTELQLRPGDLLFLYTDGVTEAANADQELYGEKRLLDLMNTLEGLSAEEICRRVKADVDAFVGGAPQFDDITMLAFRYRGGADV